MTKARFTPGPWAASGHYVYRDGPGAQGSIPLAHTLSDFKGIAERDANARLIAEAPAMLEALRNLLPLWSSGIDEPWVRDARAILARIDGPTAQAGGAIGGDEGPALRTVRADHLVALIRAARSYADDLETGLSDGTYDDEADLDAVNAALSALEGEA